MNDVNQMELKSKVNWRPCNLRVHRYKVCDRNVGRAPSESRIFTATVLFVKMANVKGVPVRFKGH
jgi:hypothetical protein